MELSAAEALAARIGLGAVRPRLLKQAKHTTIRLCPLPIVARIQSAGLPVDAYAGASREVAVATHVAARGAPTVRPAFEIDPGPHVEDGCVITLWEFVHGRRAKSQADALVAARALHAFHQALADVDADLPSFTAAIDSCAPILDNAASAPRLPQTDRHFLNRLYEDLRRDLRGRTLICRPLHGDPHLANAVMTKAGAVWMDLEAVCIGPLEWDVVTLPSVAWSEFDALDPGLMRLLKDLRSLCVATWCWADFDRSGEVAEAAVHHLDSLKARFG